MKEFNCADCELCGNLDSEKGCLVEAQSIPWGYECPDLCGDAVLLDPKTHPMEAQALIEKISTATRYRSKEEQHGRNQ